MFGILLVFLFAFLFIIIAILWEDFYVPNPNDFGSYNSLGHCVPNPNTGFGCLDGREQTFVPKIVPRPITTFGLRATSQFGSWIPCDFPELILPNTRFIGTNPGELFKEVTADGYRSCQLARGVITDSEVCDLEPEGLSSEQVLSMILGPNKQILTPTEYGQSCIVVGRVYYDSYRYGTIADSLKNRMGFIKNSNGQYLGTNVGYPNPPTNVVESISLTWVDSDLDAVLISLIPTLTGYKMVGCFGGGSMGWVISDINSLRWVPIRWNITLPGLTNALTQSEVSEYNLIITSRGYVQVAEPILLLGQQSVPVFVINNLPHAFSEVTYQVSNTFDHFDTPYTRDRITMRKLLRDRNR
jgi:hypothetical protein